jgi:Niemann-Pick C1 protein
MIQIESAAVEGTQALLELRAIETEYGIPNTFSYAQRYLDFEAYITFDRETAINVILALVAVFFVVIIFTASISITMFILLCVILVDIFLFGILYFWDITLNSVTVINIVIAIGLAVDYSAHIGHAFSKIVPPEKHEDGELLSNREKRVFKARGALGQMGSSVFHGAASTFLAIVTLSPSKSYVFMMFFKMWFGIIIFGVANGFVLLPVMLSLCGPLN